MKSQGTFKVAQQLLHRKFKLFRSFVPKNTLLEFIPEFVKENKSMPIQCKNSNLLLSGTYCMLRIGLIQGFPSNATTVTDLINFLEQTYTGPIGIEFQHIEVRDTIFMGFQFHLE